MPKIPDFSDPRYLNEVGWFLYREKYGYNHYTGSYGGDRLVWSQDRGALLRRYGESVGPARR